MATARDLARTTLDDFGTTRSGIHGRPAALESQGEARLLREALESVVSPELGALLLAEALATSGERFPETLAEARAFAAGPLLRALRRRRLHDEATSVVERVSKSGAKLHARRDEEPTARIARASLRPTARAAARPDVQVVVLAEDRELADALRAAPSSAALTVLPVTSEGAVASAIHALGPCTVVVDARWLPADVSSLVTTLRAVAPDACVALWGADLPRGRALAHALSYAGVPAIGLARAGAGPLIELLRAHAAA